MGLFRAVGRVIADSQYLLFLGAKFLGIPARLGRADASLRSLSGIRPRESEIRIGRKPEIVDFRFARYFCFYSMSCATEDSSRIA